MVSPSLAVPTVIVPSEAQLAVEVVIGFLNHNVFFWDFVGFYGILWDFVGFYGILWDFVGFYGVLWDFMGFCGIWWDFMGFCRILWDLPSGKRLHNYAKSPSFMGKHHSKWPCSIAMLT